MMVDFLSVLMSDCFRQTSDTFDAVQVELEGEDGSTVQVLASFDDMRVPRASRVEVFRRIVGEEERVEPAIAADVQHRRFDRAIADIV